MKLRPFQIMTLLHPKEKSEDETKILGEIETILAADDKQAGVMAARKIPDSEIKNLSRIEILVRPF
jgi:hypothetical protein